jgi:hypothetical protein
MNINNREHIKQQRPTDAQFTQQKTTTMRVQELSHEQLTF